VTAPTERGSATLMAIVASALFLSLSLVMIPLVAAVSVRIELETAADAAALAAVGAAVSGEDPQAAARLLAAANGSSIQRCRCPAFRGEPFVATVTVARTIDLPLVGERVIEVERSAEYALDP
jgi:hypothetical protein